MSGVVGPAPPGAAQVGTPPRRGVVVLARGVGGRVPGEVWLAARGGVLTLAQRVPFVARWLDLDGPLGAALVGEGTGPLPAGLESVARLVVLRNDPDGVLARRWRARTAAQVRVESARPPAGRSAHAHVAHVLGVTAEPPSAPWVVSSSERTSTSPRLLVHPGSGGRAKCWSANGFREVAARVRAAGWRVTWVVGEAERALVLDLGDEEEVLCEPALTELVDRAAGATAYLGNDSGPSHLAAAAGARGVLIFGPTDPEVWAPAASWVDIVRGWPERDAVRWGLDPANVARRVLAVHG